MMLAEQMMELASQAKTASRRLAKLTTEQKNICLLAMADAIEQDAPAIQAENNLDLDAARQAELSASMVERLLLDERRIQVMAKGLREVATLPDPVGRVLEERVRPNGLKLQKVATPIGVIVIIYESRPNVTADAAALCFKASNAVILRGGKEALRSNQTIGRIMVAAGRKALDAFPEHAIQVIGSTDRQAIGELLALPQFVDLAIPRGGENLIRTVVECAKVPVIKHFKGVCHVYVDGEADLNMAQEIAWNAKMQRPAVCNSMETLLVDKAVAKAFLPAFAKKLLDQGVEVRCDPATCAALDSKLETGNPKLKTVSDEDFFTEYNDYVLNIRIVDGLEEAVGHIAHYGSAHSDCIVTKSEARARQFLKEVDSAAVYWNASTRFTDGSQFGMGAEIGISTDKIGARGPMGLEELTSYKWIGIGTGQVR